VANRHNSCCGSAGRGGLGDEELIFGNTIRQQYLTLTVTAVQLDYPLRLANQFSADIEYHLAFSLP
jgi:hypothetical protein